jgi:hypothetical protein
VIFADADAALAQLHDQWTLTARDDPSAGRDGEIIQLAPLAKTHDAKALVAFSGGSHWNGSPLTGGAERANKNRPLGTSCGAQASLCYAYKDRACS